MTVEVLTGPERRWRWSSEEKAAIVCETLLSGAEVAEIARRHGINRSLLYTWRRASRQRLVKAGVASRLPDLVPVVIGDGEDGRSMVPAKPAGTIEIALPGAVHVRVHGRIDERTLRVVLGAEDGAEVLLRGVAGEHQAPAGRKITPKPVVHTCLKNPGLVRFNKPDDCLGLPGGASEIIDRLRRS